MRAWKWAGILLVLAGCAVRAPAPALDPEQAVAAANEFFAAVLQGAYGRAYDHSMSPAIKISPQASRAQFLADWEAVVEQYGAPRRAVFEAYQLVPGKRVVQVYYHVTHARAGVVVYHVVLEQSPKGRFTVFLVDIGNAQAYPPGAAVPAEKQTLDRVIEITPGR